MANVKVKNLDTKEYSEVFEDELITIPAGGHVEMARSTAMKFLSAFSPMVVDGSGRALKPKMLKIVEDPEAHAAHRDQPIRYTAPDGKEFRTNEAYTLHLKKLEDEATDAPKEEVINAPRRRKRAEG